MKFFVLIENHLKCKYSPSQGVYDSRVVNKMRQCQYRNALSYHTDHTDNSGCSVDRPPHPPGDSVLRAMDHFLRHTEFRVKGALEGGFRNSLPGDSFAGPVPFKEKG